MATTTFMSTVGHLDVLTSFPRPCCAPAQEAWCVRDVKMGTAIQPWETAHDFRETSVIGFIVAGLIIGALARLLKPGRQNLGILATLLLGVVGSVIGGSIANLIGTGDIMELNFLGFVFAVIASVLLLGVVESMTGRRSV